MASALRIAGAEDTVAGARAGVVWAWAVSTPHTKTATAAGRPDRIRLPIDFDIAEAFL
jgi:hypothetical protein